MINNAKANRQTNKQIDRQSDPTSERTKQRIAHFCVRCWFMFRSKFLWEPKWMTDRYTHTHTHYIACRVYTVGWPLVNMSFCLCSWRAAPDINFKCQLVKYAITQLFMRTWANSVCICACTCVYIWLIFALGWFMLTKTINWPVNCLASKLHWPQEENQQLRQLPQLPSRTIQLSLARNKINTETRLDNLP